MKSSYRLSIEAEKDLLAISKYLTVNGSIDTAEHWIDVILETFEHLASMPGMGRARQDISPSLRSFVKRPYLIYYEPTEEGIDILRILHGSQEQDSILRGE